MSFGGRVLVTRPHFFGLWLQAMPARDLLPGGFPSKTGL